MHSEPVCVCHVCGIVTCKAFRVQVLLGGSGEKREPSMLFISVAKLINIPFMLAFISFVMENSWRVSVLDCR